MSARTCWPPPVARPAVPAHVGNFLADLGDLLGEPPEGGFHEVARSRGLEAIGAAREGAPT